MFQSSNTTAGGSGGSLFGQNTQNTSQSSGGSLFGPKPQSTSSGLSGGLFGNNNASGQQQTGQQAPLFGQNQQQLAPQQSTLGGGITNTGGSGFGTGFGQSNGTSSILGAKPTFGTGLNNTVSSGTNSGFQNFNSSSQQQQQQQQQQQPVITPFTRPSDLPEPFQKELESMDSYIRQQAQLSEDLTHAMTDHKALVTSVPRDVQLLRFKLTSAKETLKFDDGQLAKLKQLVDTDYSDSELLTEVTNQPRKYDRLLPYFRRRASCDDRLDQLALAMRDIQHAVTAEEFGKRITYNDQGLRALPKALREEYMYFMSLSDRVAELHRHIKDSGEGEALEEIQI